MIANSQSVEKTLFQPNRFVIPVFQRFYSWKLEQWEDLWDDIYDVYQGKSRHFLGALVFVSEKIIPGQMSALRVIDGQQRLISLSLLFAALRDYAQSIDNIPLCEEINNSYLVHQYKDRKERYRIYPRQRDRSEYIGLIDKSGVIEGNIGNAYLFFFDRIREHGFSSDEARRLFEAICKGVEFVNIVLDNENPFKIFRSLNSTGLDLSESDLIRNFVFSAVGEDAQDSFDDDYWQILESRFESTDNRSKVIKVNSQDLSRFFRDIMMSAGIYIGVNATFECFEQEYAGRNPYDIVNYFLDKSSTYNILRKNSDIHNSSIINHALSQIKNLKATTAFPLLINLLERFDRGDLNENDTALCIRLISGFVLRRYICNASSRTYGTWFVNACAILNGSPVENLRNFLIEKGFPDDGVFQKEFLQFNVYDGNYKHAILREMELSIRNKERAPVDSFDIEHIMPQTLNADWKRYLGDDFDVVHKQWLHTIGNLTLTKNNPELGNKSFFSKKTEYAKSGYSLTRQLIQFPHWGVDQISYRGKSLSELATKIWIGPYS